MRKIIARWLRRTAIDAPRARAYNGSMKWLNVAPDGALGKILAHNIADAHGHKALHKGARLGEAEIAQLRTLGFSAVTVAALDEGDVHEDEAARRLTLACMGAGVSIQPVGGGRNNLRAAYGGLLKVKLDALHQVNQIEGLTIATLRHDTLVEANKIVATIKVIPFAVPEADLARAEEVCRAHDGVVGVLRLRSLHVGVILAGGESAKERVNRSFMPAIRARVEELGSTVREVLYVPHQSQAIADAIEQLRRASAELIIIAGETSIMDREDATPQGIVQAGGSVEHYGAPVEPGNLLLLAYLDEIPVIGAPGCVRSRDINVVDLILPRLLAGERLGRDDIIALADGGLLI
ncbi:MAG: molybdopterin-binding protein, partial [Chloroflexi bacterium]|nr:molybdopterin-binding protein [Chloroflexota bacterium]